MHMELCLFLILFTFSMIYMSRWSDEIDEIEEIIEETHDKLEIIESHIEELRDKD